MEKFKKYAQKVSEFVSKYPAEIMICSTAAFAMANISYLRRNKRISNNRLKMHGLPMRRKHTWERRRRR